MAVNGTQRDSSQIINQTCPYWAGDLNAAPGDAGTTNCLNGAGLGNAPTGDWYFVDTKYHAFGTHWATQTAVGMTISGAANTYVRNKYNGAWTAWGQSGGGTTGSNTANGWVKLSNGLIIQWGTSATMDTYVSFPMVFPTTFLSATVSVRGNTVLSFSPAIFNTSQWGMSIAQNVYNGNQPNTPASWMAIGY